MEFADACAKAGLPLTFLGLREAYPGLRDTSYEMLVSADWFLSIRGTLKIYKKLSEVMWQSMSQEARQKIFAFKLYDPTNLLSTDRDNQWLIIVNKYKRA